MRWRTALRRCARALGRWCRLGSRDYSDRRRRHGRRGLQFLARGIVERLARLRRQLLLLRRKTGVRRGRSGAHDHRPLEYAGRRLAALGGRATHAPLGRSDWRNHRHRRAHDHFLGDPYRGPRYRLRLHERGCRDGDHRARHLLVGVDDVGHVRVVVVVVDDGVVDHRVAAVDVLEIAAAYRIGRSIHVARTEREPGDAADVAAGDRELEIGAAHERNQRRGVIGSGARRTRDPTPGSAEIRPASVMGHGETPGRVIHPRPAPGIDPRPMSVAVGGPIGTHAARDPDVAVGRVGAPGAVRIQVLIADHVLRYIAGGGRAVVAAVAIARPAIEFIEARRVEVLVLAQAGPCKAIRLPRVDDIRRVFAVHLTLSLAHDDRRGVAIGIHFDPVFAGLAQREGEIRRVDLEQLVGFEAAHADVQFALRQLQLGDAVVEVEHRYCGTGIHADHRRADLDLGARTRVRPEAVAGGHRPVDAGLHPVVLAGGRETDRAGHVAEARDARGRVRVGPTAEREDRGTGHEGECENAERLHLHDDSLRQRDLEYDAPTGPVSVRSRT